MSRAKHNVLVIGAGSIGERHIRCFLATDRAEVAVSEVDDRLRNTIIDRYGLTEGFHDYRDAISVKRDCAVIATPAPLHIPMACKLADAKLSVLIEKPLSTSLDGVEQLSKILSMRRVVSAVGYVIRASQPLNAMRSAIRQGRFGAPKQIVAVSGQHFPTFRPAYRDTYYSSRSTGGGAIQDSLTHIINLGEWIVGPISRLCADADHQVLDGVEVEDTVHVITRHGTVMGSYSLNQYQAPNENTITVICENGTARWEGHLNRWSWMTRSGEPWHVEEFGPFERDNLFIKQANAFLDAIEQKGEPLCTLEEGIRSLRVNLAMLSSAAKGRWECVE